MRQVRIIDGEVVTLPAVAPVPGFDEGELTTDRLRNARNAAASILRDTLTNLDPREDAVAIAAVRLLLDERAELLAALPLAPTSDGSLKEDAATTAKELSDAWDEIRRLRSQLAAIDSERLDFAERGIQQNVRAEKAEAQIAAPTSDGALREAVERFLNVWRNHRVDGPEVYNAVFGVREAFLAASRPVVERQGVES